MRCTAFSFCFQSRLAPLQHGRRRVRRRQAAPPAGMGLHSSTFQLNLSALYQKGGARRGCVARVKGVLRGCLGCVWCFLVTDTAQVELRGGRVEAPACRRSSTRSAGGRAANSRQRLTLVHFSAQPEPCWSHVSLSPCLVNWENIMQTTYPTKYAYVEPNSGRV